MMNTNLPYGARYIRAFEAVKCSCKPLTKAEIEREARISPFNADRWKRFQIMFKDEIVVHPIDGKIYKLLTTY